MPRRGQVTLDRNEGREDGYKVSLKAGKEHKKQRENNCERTMTTKARKTEGKVH